MRCLAFEICAVAALVYKKLAKDEENLRTEIIESIKRANAEFDEMFAKNGVQNELIIAA